MSMRVWHAKEKRMIYTGSLTFDMSDGAWLWEGRSGSFHSHFGDLMYGCGVTIIHKKEEKELFEGDIIRIGGKDGQVVEIARDTAGGGFNTEPNINFSDWTWDELICDHSDRIEYLGHKYEINNYLAK